jgi:Methyltransferase FkbM domain
MINKIKNLLQKIFSIIAQPAFRKLTRPLSRQNQLLLSLRYKDLAEHHNESLEFDYVGFNEYSEAGEDGILLYIYSIIGITNKKFVDIGAGGISGSNTANLILNHDFTGLLIDGNEKSIKSAREFFEFQGVASGLTMLSTLVTAENINELIRQHGIKGDVDLLCIDIDGIDYWVLKAIESIEPRVVLVEYQDILGPDKAWTIPYKTDFNVHSYPVNRDTNNYCGASLQAYTKLCNARGYRLVGCNRTGWNAFFVKNGLGEKFLPEVSVDSCFKSDWNRFGMEKRFPLVKDMDWEEV